MALHARYADVRRNDKRVQVKFLRHDLLWKTDTPLTSPYTGKEIAGLPLRVDGKPLVVGPSILDMMVRSVRPKKALPGRVQAQVPAGAPGAAIWEVRDPRTLWRDPNEPPRPPKEVDDMMRDRIPDHPFKLALAAGGSFLEERDDFILVQKTTTVTLGEVAFKLAIGMEGSLDAAYLWISRIAAQEWTDDLQRAHTLWQHLQAADGALIEDSQIAALRPLSSVSQEVERQILERACGWLGVSDVVSRRKTGRPSRAGDEGKIIAITINAANQLFGKLKKDFLGHAADTDLADIGLIQLIALLGALRTSELDVDADLLEAYLDVMAPDWREQAAASAAGDEQGEAVTPDPYEVLGVAPDAQMDEITKAYRRIMQKVHPDVANFSGWFARVASAAYRTIRQQRGEP
ncbi:J domain-containing protein [Noviherbaspirillum pedocola]|nr:DnaJ domain-containing protein [Noviherbaspirillum pedocola]